MATNSWTHFPFDAEYDFPRPAVWTGLSELLVNNRSAKVMGFQQVLRERLLWSTPLWIPSHHATRSPCLTGRSHEGALVNGLHWAQCLSHFGPSDMKGRSLQMIPAPSHLGLGSSLAAPAPDILEQKQAIPAVPWPNSWPAESVSTIRWLLFRTTKPRGWSGRQ